MATTTRCYYEILEIEKNADENAIKKAYRKLALKWHPDKNPDNVKLAEEKFKEIGEAYQVLSNKDKKQLYDKYGHEGLREGGSGGNGGRSYHFSSGPGFGRSDFTFASAEDIFRQFFGNHGGFFGDDDDFFGGSMFGPSRANKREQGQSGNARQRRDPFESMFGGGFGSFGRMGGLGGFDDDDFFSGSMFSSSNFGGAMGTSTTQTTTIRDGKKVTVTKTTTVGPDGQKKTEVTEKVSNGDGTAQVKRYMLGGDESGASQRREPKRIESKPTQKVKYVYKTRN